MLVSTTLAGPGAEASIVDALRSAAPLVDMHILLGPPDSADRLMGLLIPLYRAGEIKKTAFYDLEWPNSYGEARTAALRRAEECGATWALTVDCDERLDIPAFEPADGYDALCVGDSERLYQKPRFLRCRAGLRWEWPCAERLVGTDGKPPAMLRIPGSFRELPKDEGAELRRAERGVLHMPKVLAEGENAHARRHFAECLLILGRSDDAYENFHIVAEGKSEAPLFERSWCRYRMAELSCVEGDYTLARSVAAQALAEDPGLIQELGWVLAHTAAQLKDYSAAALWASYVLLAPMDLSRGGHRDPGAAKNAQRLLDSIEAAARKQRPEQFTTDHFLSREMFADDYRVLAGALTELLSIGSALDLGAGNGLLVGALHARQVYARGLEASEVAREVTPAGLRDLIEFGRPLSNWGSILYADLVCCVEVAEHIPAEQADELVAAACSNAKRWIYWSAAQPGQGGIGHVNEQPPSYWQAKFEQRGWRTDIRATHALVDKLSGLQHCWWLKKNALLLRET